MLRDWGCGSVGKQIIIEAQMLPANLVMGSGDGRLLETFGPGSLALQSSEQEKPCLKESRSRGQTLRLNLI